MVVEDSAVQREFLQYVLEESGYFEIAGTAENGEEAIALAARLRPDIILMDCHMPKLDGIGATRIIMETCPTPIVIASASTAPSEIGFAFDAVKNGALAVVNKPPEFGSPTYDRVAGELIRTLRLMSEVKVVRRWFPKPNTIAVGDATAVARVSEDVRVIAIVGSTGAPGVIAEILTGLTSVTAPVLVVQHMAGGFVTGFATWLCARTGMRVQVAQHGVLAQRGCAYIAPDGSQMGITATGRILLTREAGDEGFQPSGTFLLRSVAKAFGSAAIGIVLTGMGKDGALGLFEVQRAGGITIAQDEQSCVVFGMPREAMCLGAASHVLPPDEMISLIRSRGAQGSRNV
jgi:two-component system chemotaxis response regulator CheB